MTHGTTEPFRARMLDFGELNALIGTRDMVARGKRYEVAPPASGEKASSRR
jgi:hypothetical protein